MLIRNNIKTTHTKQASKHIKSLRENEASRGGWNEARTDQVARARKLLRNPNYPPSKVIKAVAKLMAEHLGK